MDASRYKPRRRWPLILGGFAAFLVALYFVLTSALFLRAVVVPQIASSLNSELTVEGLSLRPFSSLTLRQVKLTPRGAETLATAEEVRLRYGLFAILGGTLKVSEAWVDTPVITVVGHPDGTSNLTPLLDTLAENQVSSQPGSAGESPRWDVRNVTLRQGTLRQTSEGPTGSTSVEIGGLEVTLDQLANGASGKLDLKATLGLTANVTNRLSSQLTGAFSFDLDAKAQPARLEGTLKVGVTDAIGSFHEFGNVTAQWTIDAAAQELRKLELSVAESSRPVGALTVRGPFDLGKKEARLTYELKEINRTTLGIAGAMAGLDLGQTTVSAKGRIDWVQRGQIFASFGQLAIDRLSVRSSAGTTPVLDATLDYKLQVNFEEKTALIEKGDLSVQQAGTPVVQGSFDRPMNIAWASSAPGFRESTYALSVKQFDLEPWRSVAGTNWPSGRLNLEASVKADQDGRRLKVSAEGAVQQLALTAVGQELSDLDLTLKLTGSVEDFQVFILEQAAGEVRHGGRPLAKGSGLVNWNQRNGQVGAQASVEVQLPAALQVYPVEGVHLNSGLAQFAGQLNIRLGQTNGTAGITLSGLAGQVHGVVLRDYQAQLETAATLTAQGLSLRRGSLVLRSGADAGGSLDVRGDYDFRSRKGAFDFRTVNLNEKAVGPFFAAAIAPNELRSVSLDWNGKLQVDLRGESSLKSALKVSRLVAQDPAGRLPTEPLAFGVDVEAAQRGQTLDLHRLVVDLGPTSLASNRLEAVGQFDFSPQQPAPSTLTLTSEGMDLTPLYDVFAGDETASSAASPTAAPSDSNPRLGEPLRLPLDPFTAEARIAALFLREMAASNVVAKVGIDRGKIRLDPLSLTVNDAPVSATGEVDVSVAGYRYDLAAELQSVPVSPLALSLLSGSLMDLQGTLSGRMKLAGAGMEGAELRKNLTGNLEFSATNLDYQISALQSPSVASVVATLSRALQLPNLAQSPLQFVEARITAGQGNLNLQSVRAGSTAFTGEAQGTIQLADIWTNSALALPITVSLPREGKMEPLPPFLTVRGTVGVPRPDINALALAQAATQLPGAAGELVNRGVNQLGGALDRALGGEGATNSGAGASLLRGLLGGGSRTNAANTNAPTASPTQPASGTTNPPANPLDLPRPEGQ